VAFPGGLADILTGRYRRMAAARARGAAVYAAAALFFLIAFLALLLAGTILLARAVGPLPATLLVALGACLIGLILLLVAGAQSREARRREAKDAAAQRQAMGLMMTGLPILRSRTGLMAAVAVGLLVGLMTAQDKDDPKA
jgi:hypothetical protein